MKIFNSIHLIIIFSWVWMSCTEPQDPMAGGSITEPFIAEIEGDVSLNSSTSSAKAYLYDVEDPYMILDSAVVDSSGHFEFTKDQLAPKIIKILVDVEGQQGVVTDSLASVDLNPESDDYLNLDLKPQAYQSDTLELTTEEVVLEDIVLGYSIIGAIDSETGLFVFKRVENQDQFKAEFTGGEAIFFIKDELIIPQDPESTIEFDLSTYQLDASNLFFYHNFANVTSNSFMPIVGDSAVTALGKSYMPSVGRQGVVNNALNLDSSYLVIPMSEEFLSDDGLIIEMWVRPTCGTTCGVTFFAEKGEINVKSHYFPDLFFFKDTLRAEVLAPEFVQVSTDDAVPQNAWMHLVLQLDEGSPLALWINGVKIAEVEDTFNRSQERMKYMIFGSSMTLERSSVESFFSGDIQTLRIWKRALTDAEISFLSTF